MFSFRAASFTPATALLLMLAAPEVLATPLPGNSSLAIAQGPRAAASFIAVDNGDIRELSSPPRLFSHQTDLAGIAAFALPAPQYGTDWIRVLAAHKNGDVYVMSFFPSMRCAPGSFDCGAPGSSSYLLAHINTGGSPVKAITAWASDFHSQNAVVLTENGNLYNILFDGIAPAQSVGLVGATSATTIAGYSADNFNHLSFLDTDVYDISWPQGRLADLNDTMTQVRTLDAGLLNPSIVQVITGFATSSHSGSVLGILSTTASGSGVANYTFSSTSREEDLVQQFALPAGVKPVTFAGSLGSVAPDTTHYLILTDQGEVLDYHVVRPPPWSSGTPAWVSSSLGTF
jgi:hypothetical protein